MQCQPYPQYVILPLFQAEILLLVCTRRRLSFDKFSGSRLDPLPQVVLHQIKRSSKSRYKYEVRRLKRREQFIRCEKMAAALASSNSKSFWQQVHRVNKSNKPPPVSSVDGISGSNHISQQFSSKFERLLSHPLGVIHLTPLFYLSADDLKAVSLLVVNLTCVRPPYPCSSLALLLTAILRHGYMPKPIRDCAIVPIPKGTGSSDNYRSIALAPSFSKALEWCILFFVFFNLGSSVWL